MAVDYEYSLTVSCGYLTDIVSQDCTATLKVLYTLFKKHKGQPGQDNLDHQDYKTVQEVPHE